MNIEDVDSFLEKYDSAYDSAALTSSNSIVKFIANDDNVWAENKANMCKELVAIASMMNRPVDVVLESMPDGYRKRFKLMMLRQAVLRQMDYEYCDSHEDASWYGRKVKAHKRRRKVYDWVDYSKDNPTRERRAYGASLIVDFLNDSRYSALIFFCQVAERFEHLPYDVMRPDVINLESLKTISRTPDRILAENDEMGDYSITIRKKRN